MRYRPLGRTGMMVSPYGLGAMMFGKIGNPDHDECIRMIHIRAGKVRTIGASTFPACDIIEAQWAAERRGLAGFRTEQPPYSILNRGIEREVLSACQRYGMGVMAWSPLAKGMLTGRYRRGQGTPDTLRAKFFPKAMTNAGSLDAVEALIPLAESAGLTLIHMALAFVIAHPAMTSAIIGPRTMAQLDDLLAGATVSLEGAAYVPPAISELALRRRPAAERAAA